MDEVAKGAAYIPIDRRIAIWRGEELPTRSQGSALFADISGFTPLTEKLADELGPKRGTDEMTKLLDKVYGPLVAEVERYHGSVVSFAGDAITCWFDGDIRDSALRAVAAALGMQESMLGCDLVRTPGGAIFTLAIKVAIASGNALRLRVGDPEIRFIDALAGRTLDRMAEAEHHAQRGDVVITQEIAAALEGNIEVSAVEDGEQLAAGSGQPSGAGEEILPTAYWRVHRLLVEAPQNPWPALLPGALSEEQVRPWVLPAVYERLRAGQGSYLSEIRPAVPLFVRFEGIDYDNDPEAGEKLDAFMRRVQAVAVSYGGSMLDLVIGDKGSMVYCVFGAPVAHDDAPQRAVAAGLDLRMIPEELPFITSVQMGISWGRMRTGPFGGPTRRNYGVLGDHTNLAARLMSTAEPGQLLVSQRIADAVSKQFALKELGEISVKGKREPVAIWSVVGQLSSAGGAWAQGEDGRMAGALVGRERELAEIGKALGTALSGSGLVLRIEGAPGVGKSHLAGAMLRQARERGMRVVTGAGQSTSAGIPYASWRQVVRELLGVTDDGRWTRDDGDKYSGSATASPDAQRPSSIADAIERRVLELNPEWGLRLPVLGDLLGVAFPENATTAGFDPRLRQAALFDLVGDLVESRAATAPLLMLLDDAHWMDRASQDLALAVARRVGQIPVLMAVVSRPRFPEEEILPGVEQLAWHRRLDVGDLSPEGVAALLENKLGGPVSPLAISLIQLETQGNPFFVEEVAGSLMESGNLVRGSGVGSRGPGTGPLADSDPRSPHVPKVSPTDAHTPDPQGEWELSVSMFEALKEVGGIEWGDGEWVVAPAASFAALQAGLPDTVEGAVLARIDRLLEVHKLTLRVASVIGHLFPLDLLALAHPLRPGTEEMQEQMDTLEARDFTLAGNRLPSATTYTFKHNITHDVAYGTLLNEQRITLHGAVSDGLEGLSPDEVGQLAYHTFAGEDWRRALRYQEEAALRAQKLFANHQAIEHFRKALAAADNLPEEETKALRGAVHTGLGELFTVTGQYTSAFEHLQKGLEISKELGDSEGQARACRWMARGYENLGDYPAALEWTGRGLEALSRADDGRWTMDDGGMADDGRWTMDDGGKDTASTAPSSSIVSDFLVRPSSAKGPQSSDEHLSHERIEGSLVETTAAAELLAIAGLIHSRMGEHDQALGDAQRSIRMAERLGEKSTLAFGYNLLGHISRLRGNKAQAIESFEKALELYGQVDNAGGEAISHNQIANVYFDLSRWVEADRHYRLARDIFHRIGDAYNLVFLNNNLGGIALNQERLDEALGFYGEALRSLEQIGGSPYVIGTLHMNLGATLVRRREIEAAREHLERSCDYFEQAKVRDFLPEMHRHMAEAALAAGEPAEAVAEAEQALGLARELDMRGEEGSSLRVLGEALAGGSAYSVLHSGPEARGFSAQVGDARHTEDAIGKLNDSLAILREVGDENEAARTELALAALLIARGNREEGMSMLEQCMATFERLGAMGDLEKAARLRDEGSVVSARGPQADVNP
ncbi:MAG: tetratricopeptide repeat protein [Chloroflexia bacterium]